MIRPVTEFAATQDLAGCVTTFGQAAPDMFANGYTPIPLAPATKIPILAGWSALNIDGWTTDRLATEIRHNSDAACGWAVGPNSLAIDIDITDDDIAAEAVHIVTKTLGDTPAVRIGQEPKSLRIYRTDGTIRSTKTHPVELFSGTGQCAVFGMHAKAGRPYLWPRSNLLAMRVDSPDMPLVTASQVATLLARLEGPLQPLRRPTQAVSGRSKAFQDADPHKHMANLLRRLPWRRAAQRLLESMCDGNRHTTIYALVNSARRHDIDEDVLIALMERHAADQLDDIGLDYIERTLDSVYGQPAEKTPDWAQQILTSRADVERKRTRR